LTSASVKILKSFSDVAISTIVLLAFASGALFAFTNKLANKVMSNTEKIAVDVLKILMFFIVKRFKLIK
jgi:hypothetical protein